MERTADLAAGTLAVERPRVADRVRVERQHGAQDEAVAVVRRQSRQVLANDVLGSRDAARQRLLELRHRLFNHREGCRRDNGNVKVDNLRPLLRCQPAHVGLGDEPAGDVGHVRNLRARRRHHRRPC